MKTTTMNPFIKSELDKYESFIVDREARRHQLQISALGRALVHERTQFLIATGVSFVVSLAFIMVVAVLLK